MSASAMPFQPMDPVERLANWEFQHGFPGVYGSGGRSLYRRCECGRPTTCLADAQCRACKGVVRINQHFQCRTDGCSGQARKRWEMLCQPCWIAEYPERAARALREWEQEKGFAGVFYNRDIKRKCACGRPIPVMNRAMCSVCANREAKSASGSKPKRRAAEGRRRKSGVSRAALADALFDAMDAADLEDALGGHLGECVVVD